MEVEEDIVLLARAIAAAKEAFVKVIEDEGYDAAYYALEIEGDLLSPLKWRASPARLGFRRQYTISKVRYIYLDVNLYTCMHFLTTY